MGKQAFLSFRLPVEERDRVKAIAARKGESVQDLMGRLIEGFLECEDTRPPMLSDVLRRLRLQKRELRQRGVKRLWVFGSVVRGEARADSDVDLVAEFDPTAKVSLTAFARLRQDLSEMLGSPADLAEWRTLRPHIRDAARQDAVAVF
jgi:predicted nucleotidyltransferase